MPKSRGRRQTAKTKAARRVRGPSDPADQLLADAVRIGGFDNALHAEIWASAGLGKAWAKAGLGDKEPEHQFCTQVIDRASTAPTSHGLEALAALSRIAPTAALTPLSDAINVLAKTQPMPSWSTDTAWSPRTAWRAVDVYDSARTLLVDYDGPLPHTLMADLYQVGGLEVQTITILPPHIVPHDWEEIRPPVEVPMPLAAAPVAEVLGELAHALRMTDMVWPRNADEDFADRRALAWSRCHDHLPDWPEHGELTESQRSRLIAEFLAHSGRDDDSSSQFLAELLLDYGEGYIHAGPLHWSPDEVLVFLCDWLPRKAILEPADRAALPQVLREWLKFALNRRGIDSEWISPAIAAVDVWLPGLDDTLDDETAWGPAKQLANTLTHRGVDFDDPDALNRAISQLNVENRTASGPFN